MKMLVLIIFVSSCFAADKDEQAVVDYINNPWLNPAPEPRPFRVIAIAKSLFTHLQDPTRWLAVRDMPANATTHDLARWCQEVFTTLRGNGFEISQEGDRHAAQVLNEQAKSLWHWHVMPYYQGLGARKYRLIRNIIGSDFCFESFQRPVDRMEGLRSILSEWSFQIRSCCPCTRKPKID